MPATWARFGESLPHEIPDRIDLDKWLIPGLVPNGVILNVAHPKRGKTWLASCIALAVGEGLPLCGLLPATQGGPVIYYSLEDDVRDLRDRWAKLGCLPNEVEQTFLATDPDQLQLDQPKGQNGLLKVLGELHPRLIVFDTVRKFCGGVGENDSDEVVKITSFLRRCCRDFGTTILLNHHSPKGKYVSARGSGEWEGGADAVLKMDEVDAADPVWITSDVSGISRRTQRPIKWRFLFHQEQQSVTAQMTWPSLQALKRVRAQIVMPDGGNLGALREPDLIPEDEKED
jgi:RecA-family ATPase